MHVWRCVVRKNDIVVSSVSAAAAGDGGGWLMLPFFYSMFMYSHCLLTMAQSVNIAILKV